MPKKRDDKAVIFEKVAIDFLSLTTYDADVYTEWVRLVKEMQLGIPTMAAFAQYAGVSYDDSVKVVTGSQDGKPHFMLTAAGANADILARAYVLEDELCKRVTKCTRIDIQITRKPLEDRPRLSQIAQAYQAGTLGEFQGRGRPKVYAYAGDDGDTLYIGSGQSEQLIRIYDKRITTNKGAAFMGERTELQLRASRAESIWGRLMEGVPRFRESPLKGALKAALEKFPPFLVN